MTVTISSLGPADFDDWLPLWQGYLAFYDHPLPDVVTHLAFDRLTDAATPMGGFIARDASGQAVGLVHWVLHPATWSASDYCYLEDLFVAPEARGAGTGRALIEAVHAMAQGRGCARTYWLTEKSNAAARQLYDRIAKNAGFIQYRM